METVPPCPLDSNPALKPNILQRPSERARRGTEKESMAGVVEWVEGVFEI